MKKNMYKIIVLLLLLLITKVVILKPIEDKKQLLEIKKNEITQNIKDVEKSKERLEAIKKAEKEKKENKIFYGRDDIIEIQNTINRIVKIQSIENIIEMDENGAEISNINLKFVGTYDEIFRVVDALESRGIKKMIKSISVSKVKTISQQIPDIPDLSERTKATSETKFECTLKISKN